MQYQTTKFTQLKSYPTYQFCARADSRKYSLDEVFRICILETMKWLRARLSNFSELPADLCTPEPENFAEFSSDMLHSFSFTDGPQIDVIYVEKNGIWSIRITEPDMGANHGTDRERPAVSGRSFITEISFRKKEEYIDTGMRTICTEPDDTTAGCEVFRLALVKALAFNPGLRLIHGGCIINGEPLEVTGKAELERLVSIFGDSTRSMPIVLIADTDTVTETPTVPDMNDMPFSSAAADSLFSGLSAKSSINLTISADIGMKKLPSESGRKEKKKAPKSPAVKPAAKPVPVKLPGADYTAIAKKLVGFAIVAYVREDFFAPLQNKLRISPKHGEVIIIPHQEPTERIPYESYRDDTVGFTAVIYNEINQAHKRCSYDFGDIPFHSDAKLKDLHNKRHQTDSLGEQCGFYRQENAELKDQIKKLNEEQTDMKFSAEQVRTLKKKAENLQGMLDEKTAAYDALVAETARKEDAYRRSAQVLQFYREYIELAEQFPTDKNEVCDWAEKYFGGSLIISSRARNELKKYNGPLDTACLCDGMVYLDAYARYRRLEIPEEQLALCSERRHWEAGGCGKETLKMRHDDYSVSVGGKTYTLDQHIKRGIHSEELIRIYFCWDEATRKIIIGSMPEHLPTVKNST